MNTQKLFLIRHGKRTGKKLAEDGKEALIKVAKVIDDLLPRDAEADLISSFDRTAVDTALFIGDHIQDHLGYRLRTEEYLEGDSKYIFEAFYESLKQGNHRPYWVTISHFNFLSRFPAFFRKKAFNKDDTSYNFGNEFGTGVYIDLITGDYKKIP